MARRIFRIDWMIMMSFIALHGMAASAGDFIWIEGERPGSINLKPDVNGSGRPNLVSDGKWLTVHLDSGEIEKGLPPEGALLAYAFNVPKQGAHAIWGRIGYEFARSPFDWRLDGGAWSRIGPEDVATDLTELSFFTEVAWLEFGRKDLAEGDHSIEIRILAHKNAKGENERLLFGLDAICLTTDEFLPNGKFKPGEEWREARDLGLARPRSR